MDLVKRLAGQHLTSNSGSYSKKQKKRLTCHGSQSLEGKCSPMSVVQKW